jgi:hypothetical protein
VPNLERRLGVESAGERMTPKQERFVEEYLVDLRSGRLQRQNGS